MPKRDTETSRPDPFLPLGRVMWWCRLYGVSRFIGVIILIQPLEAVGRGSDLKHVILLPIL